MTFLDFTKVFVLSLGLVIAAHSDGFAQSTEFKSADHYQSMAQELERLLAEGDPKAQLKVYKGGGTSVYFNILICKKEACLSENEYELLGAMLTENSATKILGEIYSFHIARLLGFSELTGPGEPVLFRGQALTQMKALINSVDSSRFQKNKHKWENYSKLKELLNNPAAAEIRGVYKPWENKPYDLEEVVSNNGPVKGHKIFEWLTPGVALDAQALEAKKIFNKIPSSLGDSIVKPSDFAKDLSNLFVMDVLAGQWDRFSGGNFQVQKISENGQDMLKLAFFDNGGSLGFSPHPSQYFSVLNRFSEETLNRLRALQAFVKGQRLEFLGIQSVLALREELRVTGPGSDSLWKGSLKRLDLLLEHIDSVCAKHGFQNCLLK